MNQTDAAPASQTAQNPVLVLDFGAQYAQLIARRVREANVYSEVVPNSMPAQEILAKNPRALILSGGPSSVYADGAPRLDPAILEAGIPVLGLCYGFQAMADALGGRVAETGVREYGATRLTSVDGDSVLLAGQDLDQNVWMSHGDSVHEAPDGFTVIAESAGSPVAAFEDAQRRLFGVQWHPEVGHSDRGQEIIENFLVRGAGIEPEWTTRSVIEEQVELIREQIGDGSAICGLSGGVDSAVAAALVQRAIGERLTCVYVNHGLMRKNESEEIEKAFGASTGGAKLVMVDAEERFLTALAGITDPEEKRKTIGREFIRVFEQAQEDILREQGVVAGTGDDAHAEAKAFLVQGTLYPDVVESGGGDGTSNIKSHHNVGGLPDDLQFELVEPLRALFKDEVRAVGTELGLPDEIVHRQPFPGPGLGIRIIGEVTKERLDVLREADAIVRAELTAAGLDRSIWQCPVVLLADVRSVGVQGDHRTYGHPVVLRPVTSEDAMTADWAKVPYDVLSRISNRITNEVREINRVTLDITSKPPGTIEWE
ncbi:glutamine-hydrolyzing GMP synthase [Helcobacillus sp. ACRRO]|uniref:GMP synthase [glutamine-hydrolyzing] n=1 Tax=Helcobacillus massiliensis TaxID=521392 RepID=A0A839QRG5_9MICO|nr:glutamine-hydrolyzing GMP synthase [Helcobacillus massiliensis]MBB3023063.1 GMP synthase (glutamine-hydrolyzing) [Helcobacillus massiliensis]MCG7426076.1 glutamine-hydrolyzing GMP synthase [Helcobacillus sp. ACRRO]MDK7741494.1 glutamine-hydrolyzing GMP synthase [Helcobacillus massiliensis]WOO92386.1 glutamine-hydrolyzing GMP synthase [Helcobacillus massiliensis]